MKRFSKDFIAYDIKIFNFLLTNTDENKPILCSDKNNAVVEMTLPEDNTQIFASKYETVLPSKEALQKLLEEQMADENGGEDDETTI